MDLNNNTVIISILISVTLFLIYYNLAHNPANKEAVDDMKRRLLEEETQFNTSDTLLKYNTNKSKLSSDTNPSPHELDQDPENPDEIDHTRIFPKIENSKYEIPVEGNIYQSVSNIDPDKVAPLDPRAIIQCPDKLDCSAKKRYDLLIEDDFESMNDFNTNCSRSGGTYSQETNNKDISKDIIKEKPTFYNDISQHL